MFYMGNIKHRLSNSPKNFCLSNGSMDHVLYFPYEAFLVVKLFAGSCFILLI